jgi:hypothetical protein
MSADEVYLARKYSTVNVIPAEHCPEVVERPTAQSAAVRTNSDAEHAFGVVESVHAIDQTAPGTGGAGANLGYSLGAARYFDTTNVQNWSATSAIGAGLLGALVGSAMLDQPPTPRYQHLYAVRFTDGEVRQITKDTSTPAPGYPVGACLKVWHKSVIEEQVSNALCEPPMTKPSRPGRRKGPS